MKRLSALGVIIVAWSASFGAAAAGPARSCTAASGTAKAALVELYTSEGCSSCPPAENTLARLDRVLDPGAQAIPIALHVDYWDKLGWKDTFAQEAFSARHSRLVAANHHEVVYTPHFFVDGSEERGGSAALRDAVHAVNAVKATAAIAASAQSLPGGLAIDLTAHADPASSTALYIAVAQSGLSSNVTRGENRGTLLAHDHVVRSWIGPLPLSQGSITVHRELPPAGTRSELVAFVEDTRTGEVLQAVTTGECLVAGASARP